MLQQTRVDTVIEYYERFLARFPDIAALASASREAVLKSWEGLGYYRRVRSLHLAAQMVCDGDGRIPSSAEQLRRLPGVGEYTSAAIASIAFGRREAAVDGNVARVLSRLFGIDNDILAASTRSSLHHLARQLLPQKRPGDFNQAWMDLGSLICTPKTPSCGRCPLVSDCLAAQTGRADELPRRDSRRARSVPTVDVIVAVFVCGKKMFVRRRGEGGLWSQLWEFPNVDVSAARPPDQVAGLRANGRSAANTIRRLAESEGVALLDKPQPVADIAHRLTHRLMMFSVFVVEAAPIDGCPARAGRKWVGMRGFAALAVSTAHRRVFDAARLRIPLQQANAPRADSPDPIRQRLIKDR